MKTRPSPNRSHRNIQGQYAFNAIHRAYLDTANSQECREKYRNSTAHQKPNSLYLKLDTARNDNASNVSHQKLYTQVASFDDELNPDGSANLDLREYFCCCGPCGRMNWDNCENKHIVGEWIKRKIKSDVSERDTSAIGMEIEAFCKRGDGLKKGDILAVIGAPDSTYHDNETRAASYWLGVTKIGVYQAKNGPFIPDASKYLGDPIPQGDWYTRVRWMKPVEAVNLRFQWEETKETYINMVSAIRVAGMQWARQTSSSFYLSRQDHEKIMEQALLQLKEDSDDTDDEDEDDGVNTPRLFAAAADDDDDEKTEEDDEEEENEDY